MVKYTVTFERADEFGVYTAPGWVIREGGKRLDWPMRALAEAEADLAEFKRADQELASDEASERRGFRRTSAI